MPAQVVMLDKVNILIDGAPISNDLYSKMTEVIVDSSLNMPDMFSIKFVDTKVDIVDTPSFDLGKKVEIKAAPATSESLQTIIMGEITSLEPEFEQGTGSGVTLVVRGYDKAHRMYRARKAKVWRDVKDSDIVAQIAQANGLSKQVTDTITVHKHIIQADQSDFDFLRARADRIGYEVLCQDGKLTFREQKKPGSADVMLRWNEDLIKFTPRLSLVDKVDTVSVRDWDSKLKKVTVGLVASSDVQPAIGLGESGGDAASSALSSAKKITVRVPVFDQTEAKKVAQGLLDQNNAEFIEADGTATMTPSLRAGKVVEIRGVGTKFSGKYRVSTVTHMYSPGVQSQTLFTVQGPKPKPLAAMFGGADAPAITSNGQVWTGLVTALVTNVDDADDKMGRVKVKYPWLDDEESESWWARLVVAGGGKERGIHFTPEVNDEVLVGFEYGDFSRPYVIGGLYNSKDTPAVPSSELMSGGNIKTRVIKTRLGHIIKFTDDDSAGSKIEIIGCAQNTKIVLDEKEKLITIDSKGKIQIHATQDIDIKSDANINIEAAQALSLKGMSIKAEAQNQADFKASGGPVNVQGLNATFKGSASAELNGGAMTTISGGLIKIG